MNDLIRLRESLNEHEPTLRIWPRGHIILSRESPFEQSHGPQSFQLKAHSLQLTFYASSSSAAAFPLSPLPAPWPASALY